MINFNLVQYPFYNGDFLQLRGNACSLNFLIVEKYEKLI